MSSGSEVISDELGDTLCVANSEATILGDVVSTALEDDEASTPGELERTILGDEIGCTVLSPNSIQCCEWGKAFSDLS